MWYILTSNSKILKEIKTRYPKLQMQFQDISKIAGFVVSDNDIKQLLDSNEIDLSNNKVKLYIIPNKYQDNIDEFITDYWDGNFVFEVK